MIVIISDFTGRFKIPVNQYDTDSIQDIIDEHEKDIMVKTIGILLYNDFIQDIDDGGGTPTQARWQEFLNGKIYQYSGSRLTIEFEGCKVFLVRMIYGLIMRDTSFLADIGFVDGDVDGATKVSLTRTKNKADRAWNSGIHERILAFKFMDDFDENYPDFCLYWRKYDTRATIQTKELRS